MTTQDVERIARDVIKDHGLTVSTLTVQALGSGWRILIVDAAGRAMTRDLKAMPEMAMRIELERWLQGDTAP